MLGKIVGLNGNVVEIKLSVDLNTTGNLINLYVLMQDEEKICVGEISDIKDGIIYVQLQGEMMNGQFIFGVVRKPSFHSTVTLVPKEQIGRIISVDPYDEKRDLLLGESAVYQGQKVAVQVNDFLANHFAIFGNTGSGKSCSVARIIQNVFDRKSVVPYRASLFIFDAYGEYRSAFQAINQIAPEVSFKSYTTNPELNDSELLRIPLWLLSVDDIALLLGAEKHSQLPIIEKAMKLVTIFGREESLVIQHKNDIIARAILDILSSGRPPAQIRDQIMSVLSSYHTKELNLEATIYQPGYSRPLKQCLFIDASGKIRDMELLTSFIESFVTEDLELSLPDGTFTYQLKDLMMAFDFALISEGVLKSEKIYDDANMLKVRLHALVNGDYGKYFEYPRYVTKKEYIHELLTAPNGRKAQIINFNINYVDDRMAKNLTKIYSKLLFDYAKELEQRATFPFHIILEEAHRYVQNDNDNHLLGYNIFERITKEGRKYGVILGLVSQRPSELSETVISQCNNFLILKMLHPRDVGYIREMVPNVTEDIIRKIKILQPGSCVAFGNAFKVPVLVQFQMPNPEPSSNSCDVSKIWFVERKGIQ